MNKKRIIPCLDIKNGKVVKGVNFENIAEIADPVEMAKYYNSTGAKELVFYDITASAENRSVFKDLLKAVVAAVEIPVCVGGGVKTPEDFRAMLNLGVSTVSINSGAIENPDLIGEISKDFDKKSIVFAVDAKKVGDSYHVFSAGGRKDTGINLIPWVKKAEQDGAGEIVVNSIDADGVKGGFDLEMLKAVLEAVSIPVIASGGAGSKEDFSQLFTNLPSIAGGLAASIFHFKEVQIDELESYLNEKV